MTALAIPFNGTRLNEGIGSPAGEAPGTAAGDAAREELERLLAGGRPGEEVEPPTDQERVIYKWAKFDGEKQGEIASRLGISQPSVSRAIRRYERWIAAGGQVREGELGHGERLRAQRWLTYERNEWIMAAALRIAAAMEREVDTSRSTVTSPGMADAPKEVRTQHMVIDRSGIASRFLRLAWRINMDQLRLAEEEPLEPLGRGNDQGPRTNDQWTSGNDQNPSPKPAVRVLDGGDYSRA